MKTTEGQKMLEKCRLFTTFYHVSELRNRDDILKAMLSNMDYSKYKFYLCFQLIFYFLAMDMRG